MKLEDWPAPYDLKIRQGATFHRRLTWRDEDGNLRDLTGCEASLMVRRTAIDADALLELTDTDGLTLGDDEGTIDIEISAADTEDLDWRRGVYDLRLTFPDDTVVILVEGSVKVVPAVSR